MKLPKPGDTALGFLLPENGARLVDKWRKDFDPGFFALPPHLNIIFPFGDSDWQIRSQAIEKVAENISPFTLSFSGLGFFKEPSLVLWLRPDQQEYLKELREIFERAMENEAPFKKDDKKALPHDFVPHLTIGFFPDEKSLLSAKKRVERECTPDKKQQLSFTIRKLALMTIDSGFAFKILKTMPFRQ